MEHKKVKTILDLETCKREVRQKPPVWLCGNSGGRKRVHLAGLGDVGRTMLLGLELLGGEIIEALGIYDLNQALLHRLEMEMNQIMDPFDGKRIPPVSVLAKEQLFQCDVFVFCVSQAVPEIGQEQKDVRMAQFEANRKIISWYAKKAFAAGFEGLFLVMSDPVELLCKAALAASREEGAGLAVDQIQGCGLGVMNGRALYFARRRKEFGDFLTEGRVFGSHGKELVVANSVREPNYDNACSIKLTELVVRANLDVRAAGFKPYIAPAISSGALTLLRILKGQWNYSSNYLGGVYFGGKNRTTETGIEWELLPLPEALFQRLQDSWHNLEKIV